MALVKAIIVPRSDFQKSDSFYSNRVKELVGKPLEVILLKDEGGYYTFCIHQEYNSEYSFLLSEEGFETFKEGYGNVTILWNRGTDTPEFDIIMESPI